jgi:pSer/pThr/pTyr-binding forkhead associated (FHA) protein
MFPSVAKLQNLASGAQLHLAARHLVGRSRNCHLYIPRTDVSAMHAAIVWDGSVWQLQDLGSRNGTFLDGHKLTSGEYRVITSGAELMFGVRKNRYRLIDDSPPRLMAIADNGDVTVVDGNVLCLPSPEDCVASILLDVDGRWQVETDDETRPLEDQQLVVAGGRAWKVCLPSVKSPTQDLDTDPGPTLADVALELFVSRDEEHVDATVKCPGEDLKLEPRAHNQLLLALVRCRLDDAEQEDLPESEHGWVYRDDLLRMLDIDAGLRNTWIFRVRQQFAATGIRGGAAIIERRVTPRQIRIGVAQITIHSA